MKNTIHYILLLFVLASCKTKQNTVYMSVPAPEEAIAQAKYEGSRIQEDDVLLISVSALDNVAVRPFNLSTMSATNAEGGGGGGGGASASEYLVNAEGYINFPVLGSLFVKGMTHQQLRADLEGRLIRYLKDPLVSVALKNFNITVLGEVNGPGQHTSNTQKVNLFQAMALAGDIRTSGDIKKVKLIRAQEGAPDLVVNLDLSSTNITSSPYYYLQQNDILYVEPDLEKERETENTANVNRWIQYSGVALGIITLIISLTR